MNTKKDPSRYLEPNRTTESEIDFRIELENYYQSSFGTNVEKLQNFSKYVPIQEIRKLLVRHELFKKVLDVHGSIVECGVLYGGGLMTWAHLSEIFEPINHTRNIIGFDTFEGFVDISEKDKTGTAEQAKVGGLKIESYEDIQHSVKLHNANRLLKHIEKVKLVKGDIKDSLPKFLDENPHLVVSLLWLDFDIYEPTKIAIEGLIKRIPKGGIIAFDELNHEVWPGETIALMETIGINNLEIKRFPFGGTLSYAIIK